MKEDDFIIRTKEILFENRSLKDIVFISNSTTDYVGIYENLLPIKPYRYNKYDNCLPKLKMYLLKHILEAQDVREIVKRDFLSQITKKRRTSFMAL